MIGPGSFVSPDFKLGEGVTIGRNCILSGSGSIGAGTRIGDGVIISGAVIIGRDNVFHPYCVIGEGPMYPDKPDSIGPIVIGDHNVFREYVSINGPALTEATAIGDDCYLMGYVHISHDCKLANNVKMAMHAALAGSVTIGEASYIGMHAAIHQRSVIGAHAMVGMGNAILKHVPPYAVVHSGKFHRINAHGLKLRGFSEPDIAAIRHYYADGQADLPPAIQAVIDSFAQATTSGKTYSFKTPHAAG